MNITFLGATKTVTGSNFLLEAAGKKILVDCGLHQGKRNRRLVHRKAGKLHRHQLPGAGGNVGRADTAFGAALRCAADFRPGI